MSSCQLSYSPILLATLFDGQRKDNLVLGVIPDRLCFSGLASKSTSFDPKCSILFRHLADLQHGRSVCIIINPIQKEVTHVVIKTKGLLGIEYMVPVGRISSSTPHQIQLNCTRKEMIEMEPFIRSHFIGSEDSEYRYNQLTSFGLEEDEGFLWPYAAQEDLGTYIDEEQIPYDELGIHRGAHVEAADGRIGRVDEFIINPENDHMTHLVLREGHMWGKKDVTIPVSEIERMKDDVVYLKLTKTQVQELPGIPIERWWRSD